MTDTNTDLMQGVTVGEYNRLLRVANYASAQGITQAQVDAWFRRKTASDRQATDGGAESVFARSRYSLGPASRKELEGVNVDLVRCVQLAITLTTQDFCVYDGLRTVKEQQAIVAAGKSRTMQSKHLVGLAADLVPWIGGKPVWDWDGCYKIAYAMDLAATQLGMAHRITWGAAWDRTLADFGSDLGSYEQEVILYRKRHAGSDFIDGPHFQIVA